MVFIRGRLAVVAVAYEMRSMVAGKDTWQQTVTCIPQEAQGLENVTLICCHVRPYTKIESSL
jgi:hypothetical protein